MMELLVCRITGCPQRQLQQLYLLSNEERRRKADTIRLPEKKVQSLAAGLLLSYLQGRFNQPYHSLSHSGEFCAAAVSDQSVGIDVETIRPVSQALWQRVCTERERAVLSQSATPDEDFIRYWTLKEAYFKARGGESSLAVMRSACFASEPPQGYRFWSTKLNNSILSLCQGPPTAR